jgi:hypothetical protein
MQEEPDESGAQVLEDPEGYTVALEEARRAIDQQHKDFASVRERSTGLLTIGGLAAAFLKGISARQAGSPITSWSVVAAIAFLGIAVIVFRQQWRKTIVFRQDALQILEWIEQSGFTGDRTKRTVAYYHGVHVRQNQSVLGRMTRDYQLGVAFLSVELVALIVDLRGR